MGWRRVTSEMQGGKMLSTMTMDTDSAVTIETDTSTPLEEDLLFRREVGPFIFLSLAFFCTPRLIFL